MTVDRPLAEFRAELTAKGVQMGMDQRMWRPEDGGWRARPYEVAVGGAQPTASAGSDLPPVQPIVQFVKPDPSKRQMLLC